MDSFVNIPSGPGHWKPPVTNFASLPATGNSLGDVRLTEDTGTIYWWNGTTWESIEGSTTNSFSIIQTDNGTSPVATSPNDTLTLTSSDGSVVITGNSGTDTVNLQVNPSFTSPLTTKGDLFGYSTMDARIPVGTNGQVLTANSAQALGVQWETPTPPVIYTFADSLVNTGGIVTLVNDTLTPGASSYYGTNAGSILGYYPLPVSGINQLTGDGTAGPGTGSQVFTLATVNSDIGTFGSSTAIPSITVNGKGLITAITTDPVIAPAGTLTGITLASNVVNSSLTSVGTLTSGTWNGSTITVPFGGTGNISFTPYSVILGGITSTGNLQNVSGLGTTGQILTSNGAAASPTWQNPATSGTVTSVALADGSTTPIYTITGSPVTSSGTLTFTLNTEPANFVFIGPTSGPNAEPTFRAITAADIPFPISGFTPGSVIFAGATGALTQDNTEFFWDNTNFRLGIGTNTPATILDIINNTGANSPVETTGYGGQVGFRGRYANGTLGSPTAAVAGNILNYISGRGYGTNQFAVGSTSAINIVAGATFTNTSNPTYIQFQVTPTGSVTLAEAMRINSTGHVLIDTITDDGVNALQIGSSLGLEGTVSGYIAQQAAATTTSYTITWPATQGTAQTFLSNNGSGTLSWASTAASPFLVTQLATNYSILASDLGTMFVLFTSSGGFSITLPDATTVGSGFYFRLKEYTGTMDANNVLLVPTSLQEVEGANVGVSYPLSTNWGSWIVFTDGNNWYLA